jgi:hypothetical protein
VLDGFLRHGSILVKEGGGWRSWPAVVVGDLEHRAKKKIQILSVNMLAPMSDGKLTHMLKRVPPPRWVNCASCH